MKEMILSTAKEYIEKAVTKNTDIPQQKNTEVSNVIFNSLQSQLGGSGFNVSQLSSLLGGGTNNSFTDGLKKTVIDALISKTGLQQGIAQNVAGSIIPGLVSAVLQKVGGGGIGSVLGGFFKK